jgi:hypothetical protein
MAKETYLRQRVNGGHTLGAKKTYYMAKETYLRQRVNGGHHNGL